MSSQTATAWMTESAESSQVGSHSTTAIMFYTLFHNCTPNNFWKQISVKGGWQVSSSTYDTLYHTYVSFPALCQLATSIAATLGPNDATTGHKAGPSNVADPRLFNVISRFDRQFIDWCICQSINWGICQSLECGIHQAQNLWIFKLKNFSTPRVWNTPNTQSIDWRICQSIECRICQSRNPYIVESEDL